MTANGHRVSSGVDELLRDLKLVMVVQLLNVLTITEVYTL